jgi:hypothetical protein
LLPSFSCSCKDTNVEARFMALDAQIGGAGETYRFEVLGKVVGINSA